MQEAPLWLRIVLAATAGVLFMFGAAGSFVVGDGPAAVSLEAGSVIEDVVGTTVPAAPEKFYASDSKFKAAFPGTPERSTERVEVAPLSFDLTSYLYEREDIAYMVMTSPYAAELPFDFDGAAQGAADEIDGTVESQQERMYQGLQALEIVISFDGGLVRQMMVRAPDRIVQLIVASDDDTATRYNTFRDSLEIL